MSESKTVKPISPKVIEAIEHMLRTIWEADDAEREIGSIAVVVGLKENMALFTSGCECAACLNNMINTLSRKADGRLPMAKWERDIERLQ